jgi:hypothetical protein
MYANLRVVTPLTRKGEVYAAHEVVMLDDGTIKVKLDANNGESSYAEPAGVKLLPKGTHVTITADF